MSQPDTQTPLLPALLDRLIDEEPKETKEPLWSRSYTVGQLREAVRRDLENLLNTRQSRPELYGGTSEAARSVLAYGVPDFTAQGLSDLDQQERLRRAVEQAIRVFEPRLQHVQVKVHAPENAFTRTIHLTIDSVLHVEPVIEPVAFDTVVETSTGTCEIRSAS